VQTLTIQVDDRYVEQIIAFLQQIPQNKREIYQHKKIEITQPCVQKEQFLKFLEEGPTLSKDEITQWEKNITDGYASWKIEAF